MYPSIRVISGQRTPRGYQQITSLTAATALTVPVTDPPVQYCVIQCEGTSSVVRWRDDGVDPTATVGMQLASGQEMDYAGIMTALKFIDGTSTSKLNVSYYS